MIFVHPEDLDRITREVEEYTAKKLNSFTQEYRVLTREGDIRWVDDRTVIQCDAEGEVTHYLGIITVITKKKNAETALKLSQEKYRALVESTDDFVWEVDRNGIYTYCSPQAETECQSEWQSEWQSAWQSGPRRPAPSVQMPVPATADARSASWIDSSL